MTAFSPIPGEHDPLDDLDGVILDSVARVYEAVDPAPKGLVDQVTFNLTLAGLQAEVAQLQHAEPSVARAAQPVESMTFAGSRTSLMITVSPGDEPDDPVRVDGWVTLGGTVVELVTDGAVLTQTADDRGRLLWSSVPRGMVHFVIRSDDPGTPSTLTPRVEL